MSSQASKRARRHRKQARHAGQPRWLAHPSHMPAPPRKRRGHGQLTLADVLADEEPPAP